MWYLIVSTPDLCTLTYFDIDIDDQELSLLLYADDITLIPPDAKSLQLMLNKLNEWYSKWRLSVNSDKTKIDHLRPA